MTFCTAQASSRSSASPLRCCQSKEIHKDERQTSDGVRTKPQETSKYSNELMTMVRQQNAPQHKSQ